MPPRFGVHAADLLERVLQLNLLGWEDSRAVESEDNLNRPGGWAEQQR
jgi:hypothetical protein